MQQIQKIGKTSEGEIYIDTTNYKYTEEIILIVNQNEKVIL